MPVRGDEAGGVLWQPLDAGAYQARKRDHSVGRKLTRGHDFQLAVDECAGVGGLGQRDVVSLELFDERGGRVGTEKSERRVLRRHHAQGHARDLPRIHKGGRQQRELIER